MPFDRLSAPQTIIMVGFSVPIKMRLQQIHCVSRRYEAKTAGVIKVQQIGNRHGI